MEFYRQGVASLAVQQANKYGNERGTSLCREFES